MIYLEEEKGPILKKAFSKSFKNSFTFSLSESRERILVTYFIFTDSSLRCIWS